MALATNTPDLGAQTVAPALTWAPSLPVFERTHSVCHLGMGSLRPQSSGSLPTLPGVVATLSPRTRSLQASL